VHAKRFCGNGLSCQRFDKRQAGLLNRESERIPRSVLRGQRAYLKMANFLTVEDSLQLAAGIFNGAIFFS